MAKKRTVTRKKGGTRTVTPKPKPQKREDVKDASID
jgi:hypothetical protein